MFIFFAVLASLPIGLVDVFFFQKGKKFFNLLFTVLTDILCCNFLTIGILEIVWQFVNGKSFFPVSNNTKYFPFIYFGMLLAVGFLWMFVFALIDKQIEYKTERIQKKWQKVLRIVSIVLFALGIAAFTGTIWGKETFGDITPDQMLINMFSPTDGTSDDIMDSMWTGPVFKTAASTLFFIAFAMSSRVIYYKKKIKKTEIENDAPQKENSAQIADTTLNEEHQTTDIKIFPHLARTLVSLILSLAVLVNGVAFGVVKFDLIKLMKMYVIKSSFIEENFVDPRDVKIQFPEKKRNLIHIYLESMENSFISKDLGGYMDENLIKPLTDLAKEGFSFSHLNNGFGGAVSTPGCTWSVASMVNMNCGIPMKVTTGGNNYGEPGKFMPGAISIGDILESQGYEQTLMFGATAKFGGLNFFYESHGGFKIMDYDFAKANGLIPKNYKVWWGYEDDKLFEFAKEELTRLSQTGNPFNFVLETADTHFPDGYVSKNTPRTSDNQYADVIAYSASEVSKFVEWIKQQPFYENTTIVLIGDHNSMDTKFFADFDESYLRTTFNLILNPAPSVSNISSERMQNRWFYNADMFPTILASIGVKIEGDRLALGTNLFSDTPTLFEANGGERGWKNISKQFELMSPYYNNYILEGANEPFDTKNISYY